MVQTKSRVLARSIAVPTSKRRIMGMVTSETKHKEKCDHNIIYIHVSSLHTRPSGTAKGGK